MRRSSPAVALMLAAVAAFAGPAATPSAAAQETVQELAALPMPLRPPGPAPSLQVTDPLVLHVTVVTPRAVGSAFPLERGVLATAAHLVADLAPGAAVTLRRGGAGGATVEARLIAVSRKLDLALLRAPEHFALAPPPRDATLSLHVALVAAGSVPLRDPVLLAQPRRVSGVATGDTLSVQGVGDGLIARLAGVVPGFSGGPVLDEGGRLVGMIVAIRRAPAAGSAFAPRRVSATNMVEEALVLPAAALRAETRRLLAQTAAR